MFKIQDLMIQPMKNTNSPPEPNVDYTLEEVTAYVKDLLRTDNVFLFGSRSLLPEDMVRTSDYDFAVATKDVAIITEHPPEEMPWGWEPAWTQLEVPVFWEDQYAYASDDGDMDILTDMVYTTFYDGLKIQVSLRRDLPLFIKSWKTITPEFYKKYLWKKSEDLLNKNARIEWFNNLYVENMELL